MLLSELQAGQEGIISKIKGRGAFRKRIIEMGFIRGKKIKVIRNAPLQDPIEYQIMGYEVSLRRSESDLIEIITENEVVEFNNDFNGTLDFESLRKAANKHHREINVVLVGNPNSGKTTLYNFASHSTEHVGNYGGVTIESKSAVMHHKGYTFNITDLPGTYSLTAYSPEELYVRKHIIEKAPDIVINVIDSTNIERNLYLTTQLIDMDIKVIAALNIYDEFEKNGDKLNYEYLGKMIGIPIIPTVSSKGKGINQLFQKVIEVYEDKDNIVRHIHINYGELLENSIRKIQDKIWEEKEITDRVSSRFYAIKLLEKDKKLEEDLKFYKNHQSIIQQTHKEIELIENSTGEDIETLITDAKYGFISGALKETFKGHIQQEKTITGKIDKWVTHRLWGFPIFFLFMFIMFYSTFNIGAFPMEWIETAVGILSNFVQQTLPKGLINDLISHGIIDGVGGVLMFLPNILILFLFISFMEDSGYMARAVFIMDKVMHKMGLHGQSFIPLIMGFGCNVPAIMASRTIPNKSNRIITILINPFMSCSARLPVYVLIISACFPQYAGGVLFLIYLFGILAAFVVALMLKKTLFKAEESPFVMELPPYRMPTIKTTVRHMWRKAVQYLKKIGGVILIASIIIWALGYFPRNPQYSKDYNVLVSHTEQYYDSIIDVAETEHLKQAIVLEKTDFIKAIYNLQKAEHQEKSYIGRLGQFILPVIEPLGFDWKMGIGLIAGLPAKEIIVSTLGLLYQTGDDETATLINKIKTETFESGIKKGQRVFTAPVALAFMLFILLYTPCIGTLAAIGKETGGMKWAVFTAVYSFVLAWVVAFLTYNIGMFFQSIF
jgi:ferrous iron transport protein B